MTLPTASLSLDLDNQWCYLRAHGVAGWDKYPSYLNVAVPRILRTCVARELRLTCFVVGRDAAVDEHRDLLAALAARHEIGNHSLNHVPWIHTLSRSRVETEIREAEERIEQATGQRPVGFRGPAYSLSEATLAILAERGYEYDATTLPTYLGPLARWYFRHTASPEAAEEAERRELFGTFCEGLRSIRPYVVSTAAGELIEMPITTFPLVRLPIHMTYLVYLWQFSPRLARSYFWLALTACRLMSVAPSLLLHPLDFLDAEDVPDMRFFPGMTVPSDEKLALVDEVLALVSSRYVLVPIREHARQVRQQLGVAAAASQATMPPEPLADPLAAR